MLSTGSIAIWSAVKNRQAIDRARQKDLFQPALDQIIDMSHALVLSFRGGPSCEVGCLRYGQPYDQCSVRAA